MFIDRFNSHVVRPRRLLIAGSVALLSVGTSLGSTMAPARADTGPCGTSYGFTRGTAASDGHPMISEQSQTSCGGNYALLQLTDRVWLVPSDGSANQELAYSGTACNNCSTNADATAFVHTDPDTQYMGETEEWAQAPSGSYYAGSTPQGCRYIHWDSAGYPDEEYCDVVVYFSYSASSRGPQPSMVQRDLGGPIGVSIVLPQITT